MVVANFLAILELYKRGLVTVRQDELFGDIDVAHVEGADPYELDQSILDEIDSDETPDENGGSL